MKPLIHKFIFVMAILGLFSTFTYLKGFSFEIDLKGFSFFNSNFILGIVIFFFADFLKAKNFQRLVYPIHNLSFSVIFRGLYWGSLFNTLLPFRLGEIIRAETTGREREVSRLSILVFVIFEKIVDVLIVTILGIGLLLTITQSAHGEQSLFIIIGSLLTFLFGSIFIFHSMLKEKPWLLKVVYQATSLFRDSIKCRLRFSFWGAIQTLKLSRRKCKFRNFFVYSILVWIVMITGLFLVSSSINIGSFSQNIKLSIVSLLQLGLPSDSGSIGTFLFLAGKNIPLIIENSDRIFSIAFIFWCILNLTLPILGLPFILIRVKKNDSKESLSVVDKLSRKNKIDQEFSGFLEDYFSGNNLKIALSNHELSKGVQVKEILPGGSNAIVFIAKVKDQAEFVRKIALKTEESKMRSQIEWYRKFKGKHVPKIINSVFDNSSIYFDLELIEGSTFFNYIHSQNINQSKRILEDLIKFTCEKIHRPLERNSEASTAEEYIKEKAIGKFLNFSRNADISKEFLHAKNVYINGVEYSNFNTLINLILSSKKTLKKLNSFASSPVHGDITINNVIIDSKDNFFILDPNNENKISGPVLDFSKLAQSLNSGYEFLCKVENLELSSNRINFDELKSETYSDLWKFLNEKLKIKLSKEDHDCLVFHEAIHYMRMLPYKHKINPKTSILFYAVAIRLFNQFAKQENLL